jgi:hypothetical protein
MKEKVFYQVKENLPPPIQNMQQTSQIMTQNKQNQLVVNMLNADMEIVAGTAGTPAEPLSHE